MQTGPDSDHAGMPRALDLRHEPLRIDAAHDAPSSGAQAAGAITGSRCVVAFDPDGHHIRLDPGTADARLALRVRGEAGLARTSAAGSTRDIVIDGSAFTERCVVLHDRPCAILDWAAHDPASATAAIRLEIVAHTGRPQPDWRVGDGAVRIDGPGCTLVLLTRPDARLAVRDDLDALRIDAVLPARTGNARIAVVAAFGEGDDIDSIIDAARNADARIRARTATLRRRDRESLRLRSSDPVADATVRNAVHRIDAVPVPAEPDALSRLALAALAAGEAAIARQVIRTAPDDPAGMFVRLHYAWTGDRSLLPPGSTDPEPPDIAAHPPPAATAARRIVVCDPVLAVSVTDPILGLVLDLLGAEPDAGRGRLRLRPVLPDAWRFMEVTGLPMADSRIRLRVDRTGTGLDIEIEQTHGAMPVRVILEPIVTARALAGATVDGRPASLVPRPFGDRIRVPVQLALDHTRCLSLHLA